MKYHFSLLFTFLLVSSQFAQDTTVTDTSWTKGGLSTITFSQSTFENWAAGGENSFTANARVNLFANYKHNNWIWDNSLDLAYGRNKRGESDWRKTDDLLDLNTKAGYKASKKWYISGLFQFKTQFDKGIDYSDTSETSKFFNPAFLNFGVGMDYKPNKHLSVYISPINSKMTYVSDTAFSQRYSVKTGENLKYDLGVFVKASYQKELFKNLNILTRLDLFADYEDLSFEKIDVSWEVLLSYQVWKVLAININTNVLYDDDIKPASNPEEEAQWQFKEVLGVGLTYKF